MNTIGTADYLSCSREAIVPRAMRPADAWFDHLTDLYLLSFLLTADKVLAEQCFSDAMEDCAASFGALSDWASGPGKIAVIRRAVQAIRPVPKRVRSWSCVFGTKPLLSAMHQPFSTITSLGAFERFVFVLSVLEGHADAVCAALLERELADIVESRDLAHRLIAALELDDEFPRDSVVMPMTTTLISQRSGLC